MTIVKIVKGLTLAWFVVHFLLTVLYVSPLNPLKLGLYPLLEATIGTYFIQNWNLFAPNPVQDDMILLVQPRNMEDSVLMTNEWYNLSSPFWAHFQKNRFSAYDRLARSQSSAIRNTLTGDINLIPIYDACQNGDSTSCQVYDSLLAERREIEVDRLVKIASAFCNDIEALDEYSYVAIRIRVKSFPAWSERYEDEVAINDYDIGTYPIDKSIVPMGLFD